jgi:PAS domain S-box-containing protein
MTRDTETIFAALRKQAEIVLHGKPIELSGYSAEDMQHLLHELQVHQIELELQNEQLSTAHRDLEVSRNKYADLYDFAPVGYFAVDAQGLILEVNLTGAAMLGTDRHSLIRQPLAHFIDRADQDAYYFYQRALFSSGTSQPCEIRLVGQNLLKFYARLEGIAVQNSDGTIESVRLAIIDITKRKIAEEALQKIHEDLELRVQGRTADLRREITERQQTESALQASEERYKRLLHSVTDYIFTVRVEQGQPVETRHGSNCVAVTGYTSQEYEADPNLWYEMIYETDRQWVTEQTEKLRAGESVPPVEHRIIHKDGSIRWIRNTVVLRRDDQGQVISYEGLITDITERKHLQEQLEAIYLLGQELTLLLDEAGIIERVLLTAANLLKTKNVVYGVVNTATNELEYHTHNTDKLKVVPKSSVRLDNETDIGVSVIHHNQAINISDTQQETRYNASSLKLASRSCLCVPLTVGQRVIGVLQASSLELSSFSNDDQKLLQTLADHTAVALETARLYQEIRQRVEELTRLNEEAEMLRQATAALTSTLDLDQVLEAILTHLEQVVPYDSACVLLWEEEGLRVVAARGHHLPEQIVGTHYPTNPPAYQEFNDNIHALMLSSVLQGLGDVEYVPGWLGVPLTVRGEVIGYLTLDSQRTTTYAQTEVTLAQAFANQAAVAIQNARLYQAEREQFRRLEQSQSQLIQAEKMAALGRLMASVAHEINNPLQAIQNSLALLEREVNQRQLHAKMTYHLKVAGDEIERISSIVQRVRRFFRPMSHTPPSGAFDEFYRSADDELRSIDLHAILDDVLQLNSEQFSRYGIAIQRKWATRLPPIWGNSDQLKQVFLNLVLNATDAMAKFGGILFTSTGVVRTRSGDNRLQTAVRIIVSDTGAGMAPEVQALLFEPFFTTKEQGSGLGLFVSYKIIESHRGRISVESHPGLGTTFTVLLPIEGSS